MIGEDLKKMKKRAERTEKFAKENAFKIKFGFGSMAEKYYHMNPW